MRPAVALLVTFLVDLDHGTEDDPPRLWLRDAEDPDHVADVGARPGERELLAALALPAVLRRRPGTVGPRTRAEIRAGLDLPLQARGADLDRRVGKDASTRSRRLGQLRERLAARGVEPDDVLPAPTGGEVELRSCAVDLVELVAAADAERWEDGARLLGLPQGRAGRPIAAGVPAERFAASSSVTEPEGRALVAEAVAAVVAAWPGVDPPGAPGPRSRRSAVLLAAGACAFTAVGAGGAIALTGDDGAGASATRRVVLTVDNRVTAGADLREDTSPVHLTSRPVPYCGTLHCDIPGTARTSGGTYDAAVCRTVGGYVTNGDDSSSATAPDDDANPGLVRTTNYYGVRLTGGTFGYVSEAWIRRGQRGGAGLGTCPR